MDLVEIGPRQALVGIEVDLVVTGIVGWSALEAIRSWPLEPVVQVQRREVHEGASGYSRRRHVHHLTHEPRHVRGITDDPAPVNEPTPLLRVACEVLQHAVSALQVQSLKCDRKGA